MWMILEVTHCLIRGCVKVKSNVIINDKTKIIVKGKIFWLLIKELETWSLNFKDGNDDDSSSKDESFDEEMENKSGSIENDFELDNDNDLDHRHNDKEASASLDPKFPPGFTPAEVVENVMEDNLERAPKPKDDVVDTNKDTNSATSRYNDVFKHKLGGSILHVMDELIKVGQTMGYNMEGCMKNIEAIISTQGDHQVFRWISCLGQKAKKGWIPELNTKHHVSFVALQETKMDRMDLFSIKAIWGNFSFDYVFSPSVGFSGDYLHHMIDSWDGECVLLGDFNEVRSYHERYGTIFNLQGANAFNNFITMTGLVDLPLEGYSYTWSHKTTSKMSKLDRFLISKGLLTTFPSLSALCFDRNLSDHRLILMRELNVDYGPTMFRLFHSWFNKKGFDKMNSSPRLTLESQFLNSLSSDQQSDLERDVSYDEIKKAVWDRGINKSPGPNGFTFEFFHRFWNIIDKDVVSTVSQFFSSGIYPQGCNSSFIALIPKTHEAKMVKDFRPISLIGSVYKIIAKILAHRFTLVILSLISDVQAAFVSNRQILDGPFIINELLWWCKHKYSKAMVFNVDFEKDFDSIQGCLNTAMGSIHVNGSPTPVKFHKGLKQGDPLFTFLFILIMESLHFSFKNVVNASLYKGIPIDDTLTLSYLFYVDDVMFVDRRLALIWWKKVLASKKMEGLVFQVSLLSIGHFFLKGYGASSPKVLL
ncbi:RNA-directed DNA polymerase, eukaryota [Tanacetum coccineum]